MKVIYLVRHQRAGIIPTIAFTNHPTEDELLTLGEGAERKHPAPPGKDKGFVVAQELLLLEPGESLRDIIKAKMAEAEAAAAAAAAEAGVAASEVPTFSISGSGHVRNPGEAMTIGEGDVATITMGSDGNPTVSETVEGKRKLPKK